MQTDPAPVLPAPSTTAFVGPAAHGPVDMPVRIADLADHVATFRPDGGPPTALDTAVELFFANGGTEAVVVRSAGAAPDQVVPVGGSGGLHAVPGPFSVLVLAGVTAEHPLAVAGALDRCELERAVLLLDLPPDADATTARLLTAQVSASRSRAAAYLPWLVVDEGGERTAVPPSGAVAGVLSRMAAEGAWGAPAGADATLRAVSGTTAEVRQADLERLALDGVNTVRTFPGGPQLWGARTLAARDSSEPAERYLSVRRLTDHVLTSLEDGMQFVAGRRPEPGVGDLVRRRAEDFLDGLWRRGALVGDRPERAYFARCDASTTTSEDLAAGRMVLLVGLAALKPGEFEVHRLVLDTAVASAPQVLPAQAALAAATRAAKERLTVVRRVDLRPLVSGDAVETERRLSREFSAAASSSTVLLLQEADSALARRSVGPLIERLSRESGVPYVLSGRRR
ncbi:MAG: hypothetical protein DCC50_13615 [Acidobacteria bacterium]|nr:MAG: hypothetical protein DCC50_13615 [Acidobacteriota bacterium]